jgi:hypothetical protein
MAPEQRADQSAPRLRLRRAWVLFQNESDNPTTVKFPDCRSAA